jgi:hypothetical protein
MDKSDKTDFSDLFSEYKLIFPEAKDSAFFGLQILRIEKYQNKIYLLNQVQREHNLLCFDTTGRFLFCIDRKGNGPGEYSYLGDFFIDKQLNMLVLDASNQYLYCNLNGDYQYTRKKQFASPMMTRRTAEFNNSLYVSYYDCTNKDDCSDILFLDRNTLEIKKSVKCTNSVYATFTPLLPLSVLSDDKNTVYYYGGNDTIYDISIDRDIVPVYYADFGDGQQIFKKNFKNTGQKALEAAVHNKKRRTTFTFLSNEKYFAITYAEIDVDNLDKMFRSSTVFYDRHKKRSYNTNKMNFDIFNSVTNSKLVLLGCADGYFYATLSSVFSDEEIQRMAKSKYLSEADKKALLKMDEMSNPVIMVFK